MPHERRTETSLYEPVKRYLEALGFTVKGEVCGYDLVALRGDKPPGPTHHKTVLGRDP